MVMREHAVSQSGNTALLVAADRGHKDTVELLLDRGADLEAKNSVKPKRSLSLQCFWLTGDIK